MLSYNSLNRIFTNLNKFNIIQNSKLFYSSFNKKTISNNSNNKKDKKTNKKNNKNDKLTNNNNNNNNNNNYKNNSNNNKRNNNNNNNNNNYNNNKNSNNNKRNNNNNNKRKTNEINKLQDTKRIGSLINKCEKFLRHDDMEEAKWHLDELFEMKGLDIKSVGRLISGLSKLQKIDFMESAINKTIEAKIEPDRKIYADVISAYLNENNLEKATEYLELLIQNNVNDIRTFGVIMNAATKKNQYDFIEMAIEKFDKNGLAPDHRICSDLICSYLKAKNLEKASKYLRKLGKRRSVDLKSFHPIIDTSSNNLQIEFMESVLELMSNLKFKLDSRMCKLVCVAYIRSGNIEKAEDYSRLLISAAQTDDFYSISAFGSIIEAASFSNQYEFMEKIIQSMKENEIKLNLFICSRIIYAYIKTNNPTKVEKYLRYMKKNQLKKELTQMINILPKDMADVIKPKFNQKLTKEIDDDDIKDNSKFKNIVLLTQKIN